MKRLFLILWLLFPSLSVFGVYGVVSLYSHGVPDPGTVQFAISGEWSNNFGNSGSWSGSFTQVDSSYEKIFSQSVEVGINDFILHIEASYEGRTWEWDVSGSQTSGTPGTSYHIYWYDPGDQYFVNYSIENRTGSSLVCPFQVSFSDGSGWIDGNSGGWDFSETVSAGLSSSGSFLVSYEGESTPVAANVRGTVSDVDSSGYLYYRQLAFDSSSFVQTSDGVYEANLNIAVYDLNDPDEPNDPPDDPPEELPPPFDDPPPPDESNPAENVNIDPNDVSDGVADGINVSGLRTDVQHVEDSVRDQTTVLSGKLDDVSSKLDGLSGGGSSDFPSISDFEGAVRDGVNGAIEDQLSGIETALDGVDFSDEDLGDSSEDTGVIEGLFDDSIGLVDSLKTIFVPSFSIGSSSEVSVSFWGETSSFSLAYDFVPAFRALLKILFSIITISKLLRMAHKSVRSLTGF